MELEPNENARQQVEDLDEYRRISADHCDPNPSPNPNPNPNPNSNPNLNRKPYPSLPLTRAPALTASRSRARPSYLLRPCADAAAERERFGARRTLTQT